MNIYINCYNITQGGGITIAHSLISALLQRLRNKPDRLIIVSSPKSYELLGDYQSERNTTVTCIDPDKSNPLYHLAFFRDLKLRRSLITSGEKYLYINLSDIPSIILANQIYYFDWPFGACSWSDLIRFSQSSFYQLLYRSLKRLILSCFLRALQKKATPTIFIFQTDFLADQLKQKYDIPLEHILVLPNIGQNSAANISTPDSTCANSPMAPLFLCLSSYYTHKNLEILLKVAQLHSLSDSTHRFLILLTFDPNLCSRAKILHEKIKRTPNIVNIGPIPSSQLPFIYSCAFASIMPSLLESYSGIVNESFLYGKPLIVSDLPHFRSVCGVAAIYFDPYSPKSILSAIYTLLAQPSDYTKLVAAGSDRLKKLPSWSEIVDSFLQSSSKLFHVDL